MRTESETLAPDALVGGGDARNSHLTATNPRARHAIHTMANLSPDLDATVCIPLWTGAQNVHASHMGVASMLRSR